MHSRFHLPESIKGVKSFSCMNVNSRSKILTVFFFHFLEVAGKSMQRLNCNEPPNIMEDCFLFIITANWDEIHGGGRAHLRHSEQQRHSIEEIGVGAASIDPEVPEHWEER